MTGCETIKAPNWNETEDNSPILVVRRGDCSFVTKSYYA